MFIACARVFTIYVADEGTKKIKYPYNYVIYVRNKKSLMGKHYMVDSIYYLGYSMYIK